MALGWEELRCVDHCYALQQLAASVYCYLLFYAVFCLRQATLTTDSSCFRLRQLFPKPSPRGRLRRTRGAPGSYPGLDLCSAAVPRLPEPSDAVPLAQPVASVCAYPFVRSSATCTAFKAAPLRS
jgi:hypothetical protein